MNLLVGTRKGLWTLRSDDRRSWTVDEPSFFGQIIQHEYRADWLARCTDKRRAVQPKHAPSNYDLLIAVCAGGHIVADERWQLRCAPIQAAKQGLGGAIDRGDLIRQIQRQHTTINTFEDGRDRGAHALCEGGLRLELGVGHRQLGRSSLRQQALPSLGIRKPARKGTDEQENHVLQQIVEAIIDHDAP